MATTSSGTSSSADPSPSAAECAPAIGITPRDALQRVIENREIFHDEMVALMRQVMRGEVPPALVAALLVGLRVKKETVGEIAGAAHAMREFSAKVRVPDAGDLVDIVGTGGDAAHTFNISTASMFVVAPVRRELGVRTIFNILGPLTNPAGAPNILMGVFHPDLVGIQVRVLQKLGAQRAMVVWGRDGMDEISLGGATMVAELRGGDEIVEYELHPEDFGIEVASSRAFRVDGPDQSAAMLREALAGADGQAREIVTLNAGAALYTAGRAVSIADGVAQARAAIASGAATAKLEQFVAATRRLADT